MKKYTFVLRVPPPLGGADDVRNEFEATSDESAMVSASFVFGWAYLSFPGTIGYLAREDGEVVCTFPQKEKESKRPEHTLGP